MKRMTDWIEKIFSVIEQNLLINTFEYTLEIKSNNNYTK